MRGIGTAALLAAGILLGALQALPEPTVVSAHDRASQASPGERPGEQTGDGLDRTGRILDGDGLNVSGAGAEAAERQRTGTDPAAGAASPVGEPPGGGHVADECVDPHPCGRHWPEGMEGPFELADGEPIYVEIEVPRDWSQADHATWLPGDPVPLSDTITLAGWVGLPDVPEGVPVPVALSSSPYLGQGGSQYDPDDPEWWREDARGLRVDNHWGVPPIELVKRGYAAAFFSVRGTGESGGCVDWFGPDEQKDQVAIVEWLAAQDWSNGRVAMGGRSWMSGTAFEAAIEQAPSLKTIVVGGVLTDLYTLVYSPQGAASIESPSFEPRFNGANAAGNHQRLDTDDVADRACLDALEPPGWTVRDRVTEDRPAAFYAQRRLIDRFEDVHASVLLTHGLRDVGHVFQDEAAWAALRNAPKRGLLGYWGHELPAFWVQFDPSWKHRTWDAILFNWLDYWLKGIGEPARLGKFDYQANSGVPWWTGLANTAPPFDPGAWMHDTAWPPRRAGEQVHYLAGQHLQARGGEGDRTFRSEPTVSTSFRGADIADIPVPWWPALCPDGITDRTAGIAYLSEPATEDLLIAGNPFAYLHVSSDQQGGLVGVHLLSVPAEIPCDAATSPKEAHVLAFGSADLRFHAGNTSADPFPIGTPTHVRVDLGSVSALVPEGWRAAVVLSYGEGYAPSGLYTPEITVHAGSGPEASHVVIPFVGKGLGGKRPTLDYPPRPFVP